VLGGPDEKPLAAEIVGDTAARDLTGHDLRDAILALAAASAAVSNDSGLLHVAAALGTPSVGIFGPTSPWHWAQVEAKLRLPSELFGPVFRETACDWPTPARLAHRSSGISANKCVNLRMKNIPDI